ncbi:MAG TPA: beta-ketoacyl-[acyl-carrier-protein] synthase family protein [Kofleriaceae bacterium]|nr:beta-ketoacyl-[acyl-carrier-protein] synthase family protein [Kofleriaceae bacterium]
MTRVVVTGLGAVSPFGLTAEALWDGLIAGRSAVRAIDQFIAARLPVIAGGQVPLEVPDTSRDLAISQRPIDAALAQAGLAPEAAGILWANGLDTFAHEGGALVERSAGACFSTVAARFGRPRRMIATACASATQAIGEAFRLVRRGAVTACVAGGATAMLTPHYALGFAWLQAVAPHRDDRDPATACRPFDRTRAGFALAEGGAALVIESLASARARGAPVLAEIVGFGASQDAFDLNRPPPDGAGAELCMRRALDDAGLVGDALGAINAHGTGTRAGDPAEVAAIRAVLGDRWRAVPVTSIKGAVGHPMAAAGALQAVAAVQTCRTGLVPPTCNLVEPDVDCELDHVIGEARAMDARPVLSSSFGMGGQNATVIFTPTRDLP